MTISLQHIFLTSALPRTYIQIDFFVTHCCSALYYFTIQCIAGYGGGLPQQLHLNLVSSQSQVCFHVMLTLLTLTTVLGTPHNFFNIWHTSQLPQYLAHLTMTAVLGPPKIGHFTWHIPQRPQYFAHITIVIVLGTPQHGRSTWHTSQWQQYFAKKNLQ